MRNKAELAKLAKKFLQVIFKKHYVIKIEIEDIDILFDRDFSTIIATDKKILNMQIQKIRQVEVFSIIKNSYLTYTVIKDLEMVFEILSEEINQKILIELEKQALIQL